MYPISSAELASIRADIQSAAMDTQCQILRITGKTSDGGGTSRPVFTAIATVNAGITQPSATLLQNYDFKIASQSTWQIRLPYGTDVREGDHLLINGQELVVQVELDPRSYPGTTMVLAAEVK